METTDPPERMTMRDIATFLQVNYQYVRRMRSRWMGLRCRLPDPVEVVNTCPVWNREDIIRWAQETGRLDPITGQVRRIGNRRSAE